MYCHSEFCPVLVKYISIHTIHHVFSSYYDKGLTGPFIPKASSAVIVNRVLSAPKTISSFSLILYQSFSI